MTRKSATCNCSFKSSKMSNFFPESCRFSCSPERLKLFSFHYQTYQNACIKYWVRSLKFFQLFPRSCRIYRALTSPKLRHRAYLDILKLFPGKLQNLQSSRQRLSCAIVHTLIFSNPLMENCFMYRFLAWNLQMTVFGGRRVSWLS